MKFVCPIRQAPICMINIIEGKRKCTHTHTYMQDKERIIKITTLHIESQ